MSILPGCSTPWVVLTEEDPHHLHRQPVEAVENHDEREALALLTEGRRHVHPKGPVFPVQRARIGKPHGASDLAQRITTFDQVARKPLRNPGFLRRIWRAVVRFFRRLFRRR